MEMRSVKVILIRLLSSFLAIREEEWITLFFGGNKLPVQ